MADQIRDCGRDVVADVELDAVSELVAAPAPAGLGDLGGRGRGGGGLRSATPPRMASGLLRSSSAWMASSGR